MFGLSFTKILLIAAVVAAAWYGFKYLTRPEKDDELPKPGGGPKGGARAVEDMVRCAVCGAYQARGAGPCERTDCPARR
jgi:uncharacterized protein